TRRGRRSRLCTTRRVVVRVRRRCRRAGRRRRDGPDVCGRRGSCRDRIAAGRSRSECTYQRSLPQASNHVPGREGTCEDRRQAIKAPPPCDRQQATLILKLATQGPPTAELLEFFDSAQRRDENGVRSYLESGGDVDAIDQQGQTAAFQAAHGN